MSLDARIKTLARQVFREADPANPDGEVAATVSELGRRLDTALERVDDLHKELHIVAARAQNLENLVAQDSVRLLALEKPDRRSADGNDRPEPEAAPRARRPRKDPAE